MEYVMEWLWNDLYEAQKIISNYFFYDMADAEAIYGYIRQWTTHPFKNT